MAERLSPSHHLFFASLRRKLQWLEHLSTAFAEMHGSEWMTAQTELSAKHAWLLGLQRNHSGLEAVLDDRPVDAFLFDIATELRAFEFELVDRMAAKPVSPEWLERLEAASMLWGRQVAQESLENGQLSRAYFAADATSRSLRGLFEAFHFVLLGGEFIPQPLLRRRLLDFEIQYELRACPHREKPKSVKKSVADIICRLESKVFQGLTQALVPDASFERQTKTDFCLDTVRMNFPQRRL